MDEPEGEPTEDDPTEIPDGVLLEGAKEPGEPDKASSGDLRHELDAALSDGGTQEGDREIPADDPPPQAPSGDLKENVSSGETDEKPPT